MIDKLLALLTARYLKGRRTYILVAVYCALIALQGYQSVEGLDADTIAQMVGGLMVGTLRAGVRP